MRTAPWLWASALLTLSWGAAAWADTHYLASDGTDSGDCVASPCETLEHAFGQMDSGDTLEIAPGTYTGEGNRIDRGNVPPPGISVGEPTWIRAAEGPGTVLFDGENSRVMFEYSSGPGGRTDLQYTRWQGIMWVRSGSDHGGYGLTIANGSSDDMASGDLQTPPLYIHFKECGFHGEGNSVHLYYVVQALFEDCWTWGNGRYGYNVARSDYVVVRRNVDRRDNLNASGSRPSASYMNYWSHYLEFQNCISLDIDNELWDREGEVSFHDPYGGFYIRESRGSTPARHGQDTAIRGCIVLSYAADYPSGSPSRRSGITPGDDVIRCVIEHSIVWGSSKGIYVSELAEDVLVDHCTVGGAEHPTEGSWQYAFGDRNNSGNLVVTNSTAYNNPFLIGMYQVSDRSDYNNIFGNDDDTSSGAHDRQTDPGYRYIVRVEEDSPNFNTGREGHRGATVVHRYGADGTFYGDPGYSDLTSECLWPWPNEEVVYDAFRNDYGTTDETRGFCADGQSLTRYIWEYLGNDLPEDICPGGTADGDADADSDADADGDADGDGDADSIPDADDTPDADDAADADGGDSGRADADAAADGGPGDDGGGCDCMAAPASTSRGVLVGALLCAALVQLRRTRM